MIRSGVQTSRGISPGAHIVATGLRCAVGLTAASASAAIRASISRVTEHPFFLDAIGDKVCCASEPSIDPTAEGSDRMVQLAKLCLRDIAQKLKAANAWPKDATVLLALPEPRPGFSPGHAIQLQHALTSSLIPETTTVHIKCVGEGHAGALSALSMAVALVSSGQQELVVVGGVDSYLEASTLGWLDAQRRLARTNIRSGFSPGEGAALMAVASDATCNRLGLHSLARVRGIACTQERRDPASDTGLLGEALGEAVLGAASDLSLPEEVITDTYGDINGELARSHDWGFAVMRTATCFRDGTDYVTSAGQCGDLGAATGALGCILATEAWSFHRAHGPRALVWAASWGGLRGAVLLEQAV